MGPSRVSAAASRLAAMVLGGRSISRAARSASARRHRHLRRIDQAEHALAGEHQARAREPDQMGNAGDHNRQPECSATMPPVSGWNETRPNPAVRIMPAKLSGPRKLADRFDQIAVGLGIAGDQRGRAPE